MFRHILLFIAQSIIQRFLKTREQLTLQAWKFCQILFAFENPKASKGSIE